MIKPARLLLLPGLLLVSACGSAPHDIVTPIPLGSNLSDLDRHLQRGEGSRGEVIAWLPAGKSPKATDPLETNELGTFIVRVVGSYDDWKAPPEERNRFTGEITFYHHGTASADVNRLVYVDGKLRKKDWGFLPG
jgi:hypothetical protein